MRPFLYERVNDADAAVRAARPGDGESGPPTEAHAQFIAGGTLLLDLMKLDTMQPGLLIDINALEAAHGRIEMTDGGLRLGALARMSTVADDPMVQREFPMISQSLRLAASAQLRNMASLGGNVLQRTRCPYFRDPSWGQCNKRDPGSGCAALDGVNRKHAVLGTSDACIAAYPGDFGTALVALGARVETTGPAGGRVIPFENLHTAADLPNVETVLAPGELITGFVLPKGGWARRSLYLKVRDRESYEFALASAAVGLDVRDGKVAEARIGLGGLAYRPWRAREAEAALRDRALDRGSAGEAAEAAFAGARARGGTAFKIDLGRRTLVRALLRAARLEA